MLSIPSDFKDFIKISEGTSFWSSAWDKEELKYRTPRRDEMGAELPSHNSPWDAESLSATFFFPFFYILAVQWVFFNTSWAYQLFWFSWKTYCNNWICNRKSYLSNNYLPIIYHPAAILFCCLTLSFRKSKDRKHRMLIFFLLIYSVVQCLLVFFWVATHFFILNKNKHGTTATLNHIKLFFLILIMTI